MKELTLEQRKVLDHLDLKIKSELETQINLSQKLTRSSQRLQAMLQLKEELLSHEIKN